MDWVRVWLGAGKDYWELLVSLQWPLGALTLTGTLFMMKGAHDLIRNYITGGVDFSKQHDVLNQAQGCDERSRTDEWDDQSWI